MPTAAFDTIQTITFSSSTSSHTFSVIPDTYTDLLIVVVPFSSAPNFVSLQFNGDTGANYSRTTLSVGGTSSPPTADPRQNRTSMELDFNEVVKSFSNYQTQLHIFNYKSSVTYKTVHGKPVSANDGLGAGLSLGTWRNTNAIHSVTVLASSGTFVTNTLMTLYGIRAA